MGRHPKLNSGPGPNPVLKLVARTPVSDGVQQEGEKRPTICGLQVFLEIIRFAVGVPGFEVCLSLPSPWPRTHPGIPLDQPGDPWKALKRASEGRKPSCPPPRIACSTCYVLTDPWQGLLGFGVTIPAWPLLGYVSFYQLLIGI